MSNQTNRGIRYKIEEWVGKEINYFIVVRFSHFGQKDRRYWIFRCKCGEEKAYRVSNVITGETRSCRKCIKGRKLKESSEELIRICPNCKESIIYANHSNKTLAEQEGQACRKCFYKEYSIRKTLSYKEIPLNWFNRYFTYKTNRKLSGDITVEEIYNLWIKQDKKCNLSGMSIGFKDCAKNNSGCTCSIDRIDSSKGYYINNIQLVHKDLNRMKSDFNQNYFINLCKKVIEKQKGSPTETSLN